MSAILKFTPLYGTKNEGAVCSVLEVDDFCILLDCGWDDKFNVETLEPLKPWVSRIDAVLISHPDILHLVTISSSPPRFNISPVIQQGALPFLVGKWGLSAPVYATMAIYKMGQMFLYDAYESKKKGKNSAH